MSLSHSSTSLPSLNVEPLCSPMDSEPECQPAHRMFSIQEIISHICAFATDATLSSLARSCRRLHEPAIRQLWRTVGGFSLLAKCLPEDAWQVEGDEMVRYSPPPCVPLTIILHQSSASRPFSVPGRLGAIPSLFATCTALGYLFARISVYPP